MTEVPLANINDEWAEFGDYKSVKINEKIKNSTNLDKDKFFNFLNSIDLKIEDDEVEEELIAFQDENSFNEKSSGSIKVESLEELVNTFDEKIVNCFINYEDPVDNFVPVQVLNHEDLLNECQMWWTLNGNFGQILPVDWKSTNSIKLLLAYLIGNQKDNQFINKNTKDDLNEKSFPINNFYNESDDENFDFNEFSYDYLNTSKENVNKNRFSSYLRQFENEDEEQLAKDLDFHCLILCSNGTESCEENYSKKEGNNSQLLFTAEEVLKELDIILQEDEEEKNDEVFDSNMNEKNAKEFINNSNLKLTKNSLNNYEISYSINDSYSSNSLDEIISSCQSLSRSQTSSTIENSIINMSIKNDLEIEKQIYEQQLKTLSLTQLNEVYLDFERLIQNYSEVLIQELALRDELEFEKELKNQFIVLLIGIQNKRRKQNLYKKVNNKANDGSKYLTTVIPYNSSLGAPDVRTLQIMIKILKAIKDDSPTVPTLLTDFILKVLCPTS